MTKCKALYIGATTYWALFPLYIDFYKAHIQDLERMSNFAEKIHNVLSNLELRNTYIVIQYIVINQKK